MRLVLSGVDIFVGVALYVSALLTRRDLLFAVPVPEGFRASPRGRDAVSSYGVLMASITTIAVLFSLLAPDTYLNAAASGGPLLILAVGIAGFYRRYRELRPLAVRMPQRREVELTAAPEELPWFAWLGAGPFVLLVLAAYYLQTHWAEIPSRFPVHWGVDGLPNRWAERNFQGVFGPLLLAGELSAWMLGAALAGWYGARRSTLRPVLLAAMIASEYFIALLFSMIALHSILEIPLPVVVLGPIALLLPLMIWLGKKFYGNPEPLDPTPLECWKAGVIYYNPNDAALVVQKREGFGYTFNFANGFSWLLAGSLGVVIASGALLL